MLSCKRSKHQPFEKHLWLGIVPLYMAFFLLPSFNSLLGHMWPDLPGLLPPVLLPSQRCPVSDHLINSMPKHREWGGRPGRSRHMNDVNVCSGTLRVGGVLAISRGFFLECVRALETQMFMKLKIASSHEINWHGSWSCRSWSWELILCELIS